MFVLDDQRITTDVSKGESMKLVDFLKKQICNNTVDNNVISIIKKTFPTSLDYSFPNPLSKYRDYFAAKYSTSGVRVTSKSNLKHIEKKLTKTLNISDPLPSDLKINHNTTNHLNGISFMITKPTSPNTDISECIEAVDMNSSMYRDLYSNEKHSPSDEVVTTNNEEVVFVDFYSCFNICDKLLLPNKSWKRLRNRNNASRIVFIEQDEFKKPIKRVLFNFNLKPTITINGKPYEYNKSIQTKRKLEDLLKKIYDIQVCSGYKGNIDKQCVGYFERSWVKTKMCSQCEQLEIRRLLDAIDTTSKLLLDDLQKFDGSIHDSKHFTNKSI